MGKLKKSFELGNACGRIFDEDDLMKIIGIGAAIGGRSDNVAMAEHISREIMKDPANLDRIYRSMISDLKTASLVP